MSDRFRKYLEVYGSDEFGCVAKYEREVMGGRGYAWLSGHYSSLLDEVVWLVGRDRLARLIAAHDAIDNRIDEAEKEAGDG